MVVVAAVEWPVEGGGSGNDAAADCVCRASSCFQCQRCFLVRPGLEFSGIATAAALLLLLAIVERLLLLMLAGEGRAVLVLVVLGLRMERRLLLL